MTEGRISALCLLVIIALALALRSPGLIWELPTPEKPYTFHPDEMPLISAAANIQPGSGQWNPGFYNYGALQTYLIAVPIALSRNGEDVNLALTVMLTRLLTALMGTATVAVLFFIGKKLAGLPGACLASGFLAIAPLHVQHSQFVTVDVPSAFWVSITVLLTLTGRLPAAGLAVGLAAATKYTAGLVLAVPLAQAFFSEKISVPIRFRNAGAIVSLALLGFLVGCPGAVLWTGDFLSGLIFEIRHASEGHGLVFLDTGPGWLYHIKHSLKPGLGWAFLGLSVAAMVAVARMRVKPLYPALVFVALLYLLLSLSPVRFARYTLPLYPVFAACVAVIPLVYNHVTNSRAILFKHLITMLIVFCYLVTLYYACFISGLFIKTDPRVGSLTYIKSYPNISTIAVPETPWFYSPPFTPGLASLDSRIRRSAAEQAGIIVPDTNWDSNILKRNPDAVVISYFEAHDRNRLNEEKYNNFMKALEKHYKLVWHEGISSFPHDMSYVYPEIKVYVRYSPR